MPGASNVGVEELPPERGVGDQEYVKLGAVVFTVTVCVVFKHVKDAELEVNVNVGIFASAVTVTV